MDIQRCVNKIKHNLPMWRVFSLWKPDDCHLIWKECAALCYANHCYNWLKLWIPRNVKKAKLASTLSRLSTPSLEIRYNDAQMANVIWCERTWILKFTVLLEQIKRALVSTMTSWNVWYLHVWTAAQTMTMWPEQKVCVREKE